MSTQRSVSAAPSRSASRSGPERIYVLTGGRSGPAPNTGLDLVTLIVALGSGRDGLFPEHRAILRMCRWPLSVAEISAHLRLPFSATAVLVTDLLAAGLVVERRGVKTAVSDPEVLREVIRGLRKL